jgi:excisionase family DNA binding protein
MRRPSEDELGGAVAVVTVPALLSIASVARLLDCSTRTVRRRIDEGSLRAVVDHGRLMVRGDELRAYVEALERFGGQRARPPRRRSSSGRYDFLRE